MKILGNYRLRHALAILAAGLALGGIVGIASGQNQNMYRMPLGSGGGVPAQAVQNSPVVTSTNCTLSWYGTEGWYTILGSTSPLGPWNPISTVAATSYAWQTTLPIPDTSNNYSFFKLNQANSYAGATACGGCHGAEYTPWTATAHAGAYNVLVNSYQNNNTACVLCHTVGYGQPTGFTNATLTPTLEGVGCESCHGPAGWHRSSDHTLIVPVLSIAPEICGSCHQGYNPQYNEYTNSPHYQVEPVVAYGTSGGVYYTNTAVVGGKTLYGYYVTVNSSGAFVTNASSGILNSSYVPGSSIDPGQAKQATCGICHSGATRMAMLSDYNARQAGITNPLVLPSAADSGAWGPTCANCHDPHSLNPSPVFNDVSNAMVAVQPQYFQLRNPTWSSNFYTMAPIADERADSSGNLYFMNTVFAGMYNPSINVCGQCHNTRGARWDGLAYGLISNNVPVTNLVISPAYTYTYITNYNIYNQIVGILTNKYATGGTVTNTTITNIWVLTAGLTTNVTGLSREPHESPQYNMLIGILQPDYLNTTNGKTIYTNGLANNGMGLYATHSGIAARSPYNTNQCMTCHVPSYSGANGNVTGHTFQMDTHNCTICHSSGAPDWVDYQLTTTNSIRNIVVLLNEWASDKAPAILGAAYNTSLLNSWEYTSPGSLASLPNAGPSTANQLLLPTNILQARFDTYMVLNDGSFGVHNPTFIPLLLSDAETKVLSQYPYAGFKANTVMGAPGTTGLKVTFTPQNTGLASYNWSFGDGATLSTNTGAAVVHTYTATGLYPVILSATDSVGTSETLLRTNYINVVQAAPTPAFSATPPAGTYPSYPLTVSVTNTTASPGNYVNFTFYLNGTSRGNAVYGVDAPSATYTMSTNGTYYIIETIGVGGSSVTTTSSYIVQ
jgi:PKD repeat protein